MAQPTNYSDIALSFSPEAQYAGVPGADVSRGMLWGGGKADYLSRMDQYYADLEERQREFDRTLEEKIREFDIETDFSKQIWQDQLGLYDEQMDYLKSRETGGISDLLRDIGLGGGNFDFGPGSDSRFDPYVLTQPRIGPGSGRTPSGGGMTHYGNVESWKPQAGDTTDIGSFLSGRSQEYTPTSIRGGGLLSPPEAEFDLY